MPKLAYHAMQPSLLLFSPSTEHRSTLLLLHAFKGVRAFMLIFACNSMITGCSVTSKQHAHAPSVATAYVLTHFGLDIGDQSWFSLMSPTVLFSALHQTVLHPEVRIGNASTA
eukprot:1183084-Amphidinium_carterae.1